MESAFELHSHGNYYSQGLDKAPTNSLSDNINPNSVSKVFITSQLVVACSLCLLLALTRITKLMFATCLSSRLGRKWNNKLSFQFLTTYLYLFRLSGSTVTFASAASQQDPNRMANDVSSSGQFGVLTWNIAAINNNPFEYWITCDNDDYNKLMEDVQNFIVDPGEKDIEVGAVLTDNMVNELINKMEETGWTGLKETERYWIDDFKKRKIITGFLKDESIGQKRLASMPDRVTNTIHTLDGPIYRPTAINCYQEKFSSFDDWWKMWLDFMFDLEIRRQSKDGVAQKVKVSSLLLPIKQAKYPAITDEEERISLPLSTLCAAIFDGILIHMLEHLAKDTWQELRSTMCTALNLKKNERTLEILSSNYQDRDIIFLQEVANSFAQTAKADNLISSKFEVFTPHTSGKRDQNSVILLSRDRFKLESIQDVTPEVEKFFKAKIPVAEGDLLVLVVENIDVSGDCGEKLLLASFHGDTNGLATIPVLSAVLEYLKSQKNDLKLIFGLDANTYEKGKQGKTQDVKEFAEYFTASGLNSCWGKEPNPKEYTTFNGRTFLQPQLNKACMKHEVMQKGDVNPKDFILFTDTDFQLQSVTRKDNTGKLQYKENMVFPTLEFPSDHAIVFTVLEMISTSKY